MSINQHLNWRYATKRYNGESIPESSLNDILESIRLTPTSLGIQPFHVFVIENKELRTQLKPALNNQPQSTEASHLLVFASWKSVSETKVDDYMALIAETRGVTIESLKGFRSMILGFLSKQSPENIELWASKQIYIALGTAMVSAASQQIDATPMEGFSATAVNEILELDKLDLNASVILALGYRDQNNDPLASANKVRRSVHKLFDFI
jgi:nitroreductase